MWRFKKMMVHALHLQAEYLSAHCQKSADFA